MNYRSNEVPFSDLIGKTIISIEGKVGDGELRFNCLDGSQYLMYHDQDCCECVYLQDICGDLSDLIDTPILKATEDTSDKVIDGVESEYQDDSFTWTFYNIATIKGSVTLRWYGTSNGYYSESVDFVKIN